ncbi:endonuclease-reverse transcriptase [Elysia marginata]|uniref:Endonuclease-reverse transcriptase n=1 Tax=Elysia marginata TaxID=1093978 RepID=A0AAV4H3F1_9GAST|nr:endonuclease-reverse transcriptase [Elysia marginata]
MNNTLKKKIEAAEMWFIRRILKVSWKDKKTNDEVLDMANTGRSLHITIRRRQMKFTGHIYKARGIEHLTMTGKINGKKSRLTPKNNLCRQSKHLGKPGAAYKKPVHEVLL